MQGIMTFSWIWQRKEAFIWLGALAFLALSDPSVHHYTLCPLDNMGFHYCPGCGLGRAIGYIFRLEARESVISHPLGIPAVILMGYRIFKVFRTRREYQLST